MRVCTGPAREPDGDYHGQVVNRAARIAEAAQPGQILVAPATAVFVDAFGVRDLGEFHLPTDLPPGIEQLLVFGAGIAGAVQVWDLMARLLGASGEGFHQSPVAYLVYLTFLDRARAALGPARGRTLHEEGRRMPLQDAVKLALGDSAP